MEKLTDIDLTRVVSCIPKDVRDLVKEEGLMIGGGFIRSIIAGEEVHDIDIFGPTENRLHNAANKLLGIRGGEKRGINHKHVTPNAITVVTMGRVTVQFITRWLYDGMDILIHSFDFTVCKSVIRYGVDSWVSAIDPNFYPDLAAKRLVYTFPQRNEDAGGSMLRATKFLKRGYHIPVSSLAGVTARLIKSLPIMDKNCPVDRTTFSEQEWAKDVEKKLVEVDPQFTLDGTDVIHRHD